MLKERKQGSKMLLRQSDVGEITFYVCKLVFVNESNRIIGVLMFYSLDTLRLFRIL